MFTKNSVLKEVIERLDDYKKLSNYLIHFYPQVKLNKRKKID